MNTEKIIKDAQGRHLNIDWVRPKDQNCDESRRIANAVFSYKPAAIAYCKDSDPVPGLFEIFKEDPPDIRVRAGGHLLAARSHPP
jgi:hypothetical protein